MSLTYRKSAGARLYDAAIFGILAIVFATAMYPFYHVVILSVMPYENYIRQTVHVLPSGFTFHYFNDLLTDPKILRSYWISIFVTVVGTALNMALTSMLAYTLSKPRTKLFRPLSFYVIIPMVFSGGLIPFYLVVKELQLLNSVWALILPFGVNCYNVLLLKNFFMTLPEEIEESAKIDGAGDFRIFLRIMVPISTPGIATITLFYATFHWNEFFWGGLFMTKPSLYPITVTLQSLIASAKIAAQVQGSTGMVPVSYTSAVILLIVVPVLIVYPFLQRYFAKGLVLGAVKG